MKKKIISILGLGYIGLPTASLLAHKGYNILGIDLRENVVDTINKGHIHISEPGLSNFVSSAVKSGRLKAFTKVQKSDIYIICVPTPIIEKNKIPLPNIDYVLQAINSIAPLLKKGDIVIIESTVPVGTTKKVQERLIEMDVQTNEIFIAYCPERVLPGNIMKELVDNDRVVGGLTLEATKLVSSFYKTFVSGKVLETDSKTAEMCKLIENSYRDVNIAFANELSMICEKEGIDVWKLITLANQHPRVNILQPSTGVGGHCIAMDPWFVVARDNLNTRLIRTAREVNNKKVKWVIEKINHTIAQFNAKKNTKPKIACLGLTFKPDTDDLRASPALKVVETLSNQGYEVMVVEPNIDNHETLNLTNISNAIKKADVIAVLVKHKEFMNLKVKKLLKEFGAIDFCGSLKDL